MKKIFILILFLASAEMLHAQFPYIAGKEGNGSLYLGGTRGLVNYDFGSSRIGFGYSHYKQRKEKIDCSDLREYFTIGTNIGFAANENTFVIFSEDFKPGVDASLDLLWGSGKCINGYGDSLNTRRTFARVVVSSKQISYFDTLLVEDVAAFERTKWDVGVNIGRSWGQAKVGKANSKYFASIGLYLGYSFRDQGILKEKNVETIIGTPSGSNIIQDTEKRYIGSPTDHFIGKIYFDGGVKLTDLYTSQDKSKTTSALYLIGRIHPELQGSDQVKLNSTIGITINNFTNVVVGGILLEFDDISNQSFDKIFSVKLYAGIPIKFK